MKYLLIFFVSFSLNSFAQIERMIFLQTNPEDQYVISYTSGEYIFLFSYEDFIDLYPMEESEDEAISELIDSKIASQGFVDVKTAGQRYNSFGELIELSDLAEKFYVGKLIINGNFILLGAAGKMSVNSLALTKALTVDGKRNLVFSCPDSGDVVLEYEVKRIFTCARSGCPSF